MLTTSGQAPRANTMTRRAALEYAGVAAIFVLVTAVVALGFWPGRMNADTLVQIAQIRGNYYTNHHAPILQALWRPFFVNGAGPGWVLTAQTLCFMSGAWLIFRLTFRRVPAALAAAVVAFTPPTFGSLGLIGRDVWFLSLLLLSFGLVATAYRCAGRKRTLVCVGAVLAAWLALAARQNAAVSVVVPIVAVAFLVLRNWRGDRWGARGLVVRSVAAGVLATLAMMMSLTVVKDAIGVTPAYPTGSLFAYDLAMYSLDDGTNRFPASILPQRDMTQIQQLANVDSANALVASPTSPIRWPISKHVDGVLQDAWIDRVTADPLGYLRIRTRLFLRQIALTRDAVWTYHPFIDPNPWGYRTTFPWANDIANDYEDAFADAQLNGNTVFAVWIYLLASAVAVVLCLRRRTTVRVLIAGLAAMPLLYQAGLYFGAMGTIFRFEYPAVVLGTIVMVFGVQRAWQLRPAAMRGRRHAGA
ncbi:hypothetical protein [Conexibacter woesei]|uniref:Glycosyltransferase RgtA/B/C/D-like domain-containing protein n=1 Tax=Conexibacter woesei (strain DSM 14684 / CCUG 47730 / CIP 108061 / JCM 11494 / NBRC 100937 / ID131577) TaxID=469383 RepID=D3EZM9_CONWI|nr:hypothetical protein [Conexibacter woesei]ADB53867.1 hypothetical protein Cwoe_5462 [Conexibacter woesei DSM 14684]